MGLKSQSRKKPVASTSDISHKHRTSMGVSFITPLAFGLLPARSNLRFEYSAVFKSFSSVRPVYGKYKIKIYTFIQDLAAYSYQLSRNGEVIDFSNISLNDQNELRTGLFSRLPVRNVFGFSSTSSQTVYIQTTPSGESRRGVDPTSLDCYLGLPANYVPTQDLYGSGSASYPNSVNSTITPFQKSAIFELMYLDIVRNYMVNRQFPYALWRGWGLYGAGGSGTEEVVPMYKAITLKKLDDFFEDVYVGQTRGESENYDIVSSSNYPYKALKVNTTYYAHQAVPHGKLFLSMYEPDINNSWLSNQNYSSLQTLSRINADLSPTTSILYQDIISMSHQYTFMQRLFMSGGLIDDWLYSEYGTRGRNSCPRLIHSRVTDYVFDDVISNAETEQASLGDRGGLGYGSSYGESPEIRTNGRYVAYMQVACIVPEVGYFQGVDHLLNVTDLGRFPLPDYSNVSMESRLAEQVLAVPVVYDSDGNQIYTPTRADYINESNTLSYLIKADTSLGWQTFYSPWRSRVDRVTGELCNTMRDWVFLRDYHNPYLIDASDISDYAGIAANFFPYVFPEEYQYIYAAGSDDVGRTDPFQVNYRMADAKQVLPIENITMIKAI